MDSGQHQVIKTPPRGFFVREGYYDIFLAHDIEDAVKGKEKVPLYEAVGSLCARLEHEAFLPYRSVGFQGEPDEMPARETYVLLNEIMLPQAQLVLCYLGINSASVGSMDARAKKLQKDIIYFYEEGTHLETVAEGEALVHGLPPVDSELLQIPLAFLHQDTRTLTLQSYPKIKGVVEFTAIDDCIRKLRETLKNYFIG